MILTSVISFECTRLGCNQDIRRWSTCKLKVDDVFWRCLAGLLSDECLVKLIFRFFRFWKLLIQPYNALRLSNQQHSSDDCKPILRPRLFLFARPLDCWTPSRFASLLNIRSKTSEPTKMHPAGKCTWSTPLRAFIHRVCIIFKPTLTWEAHLHKHSCDNISAHSVQQQANLHAAECCLYTAHFPLNSTVCTLHTFHWTQHHAYASGPFRFLDCTQTYRSYCI